MIWIDKLCGEIPMVLEKTASMIILFLPFVGPIGSLTCTERLFYVIKNFLPNNQNFITDKKNKVIFLKTKIILCLKKFLNHVPVSKIQTGLKIYFFMIKMCKNINHVKLILPKVSYLYKSRRVLVKYLVRFLTV